MRVGFKSCYTTMKMEPADNVDNGMLVGGGRSGTYTAALGIDMKPKSGVHRFEFKPNLMSNGAIGIATNDQPLGTSPTQYNSTFMIYFWLNGDAFCYCKNRSRQTFKFATYKAGDNVRFILDRHEEDTTELTVEINDKQVYNFASLENIGMPKGTVLCPYAYIQYNDKLALLHTQKSRRPFAVGDAKLAVLLEKCTQLLPDTLLSEEKGDKFCEAVVKHHAEVTKLNLRECKGITDEGLEKLIAGCKSLATVDLTGCVGLSDQVKKDMAAVCEVVDEPVEDTAEEKSDTSVNKKKMQSSKKAHVLSGSSDDSDCSW